MTNSDREFDIIVWGATGFTGRRIVAHLAASVATKEGLKWAVAGRSEAKLRAVLNEAGASNIPVIVADADDRVALDAMVARASLVIATAGPFMQFGSNLVAACAAAGTDYVDITGESLWVREMIERHSGAAAASGARIVHCCGFDCVPFDLGVAYVQKLASKQFGAPAEEVMCRVTRLDVTVSGGSAATAIAMVEAARRDPADAARLRDPFVLSPNPDTRRAVQPDCRTRRFEPETGRWAIYFPMSSTNMAIVHRSNMMMGYPYGAGFQYSEMQTMPDERAARRGAMRQSVIFGLMAFAPTRALLKKRLIPRPGEGPAQAALDKGGFELLFIAKGPDNRSVSATVSSDKDPGYVSTPLMLVEAALCLLRDTPRDATPGGIYSPAAALGEPLIERLRQNAFVEFEAA